MALGSCANWSSSPASFRVCLLGRLYLMISGRFLGCEMRWQVDRQLEAFCEDAQWGR